MIPTQLIDLIQKSSDGEGCPFPPTDIYNEGWMLRLVLGAAQATQLSNHPLQFLDGASWYSEALLSSPFLARSRLDPLAEGLTHADGVIGHFDVRKSTQSGFRLHAGAKQFVVIEAKMFSNLSTGTTKAKFYNQAARNVACMAHEIAVSGLTPPDFDALGFLVIAPSLERRTGRNSNIEACVDANSVRDAVMQRILSYEQSSREEAVSMRRWEKSHFLPLVERLMDSNGLQVLSWEACIEAIRKTQSTVGEMLDKFYAECLRYDPRKSVS